MVRPCAGGKHEGWDRCLQMRLCGRSLLSTAGADLWPCGSPVALHTTGNKKVQRSNQELMSFVFKYNVFH